MYIILLLLACCSCGKSKNYSDVGGNGDDGTTSSVPAVPPRDFVKIETSGNYTFLATSANVEGGETVAIDKVYFMGRYAVTNEDWAEYVAATNVQPPKYWTNGTYPAGRAKHPVLWISYDEAMRYCAWLSAKSDAWLFRLPTEAEWEYAAAAQNRTHFPWGDKTDAVYVQGELTAKLNYNAVVAAEVLKNPDRMATYIHAKSTRYGEQEPISKIIAISASGGVSGWVDHANYLGFIYTDLFAEINDVGGYTCVVDAYPEGVTWCGCYNMCGNCWEWTSTVDVAQNGAEKGQRVNVIRGGSWYANASSCRASFRGEGRKSSSAYNTVGLRLVAAPK
ncbi:MAG: formylglycine-generating enzyme family protein [Alistipes sp.]|nr:formylglycine-generating enzyme family protein [Alistipes sp.]